MPGISEPGRLFFRFDSETLRPETSSPASTSLVPKHQIRLPVSSVGTRCTRELDARSWDLGSGCTLIVPVKVEKGS
ncbi:hypothetical protein FF2_007887 [Malus domestica]